MDERSNYMVAHYDRPTSMSRKRSFRIRQKPPLAKRAKEHCRKFTAFMFSNVGIILLVILYTIAGAFMFIAIEGGEVLERSVEFGKDRTLLVIRLWNITDRENILNETAFRIEVNEEILKLQQKIVRQAQKGGSDSEKRWSFSGAFLYSLTVITTIGYGNISPRTNWGKISTIVYAIVGMPLFLLYLSNIGDILAKSFKWTYAKLCLCRICPGLAIKRAIRERRKTHATVESDIESISQRSHSIFDSDSEENDESIEDEDDSDIEAEIKGDTRTVIVPLTTCVAIMIGYILFGATLFGRWEEWGILDGSYFCFISLSSIGFGDIVPGDNVLISTKGNVVEVSFILCAVYLLLGMALIAMCFNLMQEQVIHKMRTLKLIIRNCCRCVIPDTNRKYNENIDAT